MGTFGALLGASIAGLAYQLSGHNYILTFALSTIPAATALVLTVSVRVLQHALASTKHTLAPSVSFLACPSFPPFLLPFCGLCF